MLHELTFESNHFASHGLCHEIEIVIKIRASRSDYEWDFYSIRDTVDRVPRALTEFPNDEVKKIEALCDSAAYENSYEAYQQQLMGQLAYL